MVYKVPPSDSICIGRILRREGEAIPVEKFTNEKEMDLELHDPELFQGLHEVIETESSDEITVTNVLDLALSSEQVIVSAVSFWFMESSILNAFPISLGHQLSREAARNNKLVHLTGI